MKITLLTRLNSYSLGKKIPGKKRRLIFEIEDSLITKTLYVLDEILDRAHDGLENEFNDEIEFPLIPDSLPPKYKNPDSDIIRGHWILEWQDTELKNVFLERSKIIAALNDIGVVDIRNNLEAPFSAPFIVGENKYKLFLPNYKALTDLSNKMFKELNTYRVLFKNRQVSVEHLGTIYPLKRVKFESSNEAFFSYVYKHPGKSLKKDIEQKLNRRFRDISKVINDIGFTGELRKAFFPHISDRQAAFFRKTITGEIMREEGISRDLLHKQLVQKVKTEK